MAQVFKYAIIFSIGLPMLFMVIVATFSVILVALDAAGYDR